MTETQEKRRPTRLRGRVAFIACREAVRAELECGATMISVYETYAAQLNMSYAQFTRYVNAQLRGKPQKRRGKRLHALVGEGTSTAGMGVLPSHSGGVAPKASTPRGLGPPPMPSFEYDPTDAYRKK